MKITTTSPQQTKTFARFVLKEIFKTRNDKKGGSALVIALKGELGSGKTTFSQGLARALGIKHPITSPTFLLIKNYEKKIGGYKRLYHMDCYRIKAKKELLNLNFKNIVADSKNIILIEWADKIKKIVPKNAIWIKFGHGKKENERVIQF